MLIDAEINESNYFLNAFMACSDNVNMCARSGHKFTLSNPKICHELIYLSSISRPLFAIIEYIC